MDTSQKSVALALGSGGARGYVHIGAIQAIEERGYEIVNISGCSMGAIVGGCYAAGKLPEFQQWVSSLGYLDVLKLVDFSFMSSGAIKLERVYAELEKLIGDIQIEDMDIGFTSVATELTEKKEVWFQKGSLLEAIRASASIPTIFEPVSRDGKVYVDGAVLNPLPIIPCVSSGADAIIAIDLGADVPIPELEDLQEEAEQQDQQKKDWFETVIDTASGFLLKRNAEEAKAETNKNLGKLEMLSQTLEIIQASLSRFKTAGYPPDLLIRIPREACEIYEFYRADEMIRLGYHIANRALDDYERGSTGLYGEC